MTVGIFNYSALPGTLWPSDRIGRLKKLSDSCEKYRESAKVIGSLISDLRCGANLLARIDFLEGTTLSYWMSVSAKKTKIVSVLKLPFGLRDIGTSLQKTAKSLDIEDLEGAFINSLGFAATSAGLLESASTFANAGLDIIGKNPFQILAEVSMPACFFMSGIGICSRALQLSKVSKLYQEIDPAVFLKDEAVSRDRLRRRLQRSLGIRQEEKAIKREISAHRDPVEAVQDRRAAKFERIYRKDEAIKEELNRALELLDVNGKQSMTKIQRQIVADTLQKVREGLQQQMARDTVLMVASLVGFVALIFFCMQGIGYLPYAVDLIGRAIEYSAGFCVGAASKVKQS